MEAELSPAFSYRQGSVRLVLKDMLACDMAIVLLPDLALRISADKLLSASIRVSFYYPVSIWRSARDLRRQQAQGVPKACKKAGFAPTGAVCRSGTTMPVSIRAPPSSEGKAKRLSRISSIRRRHLAGRVPRAKRLGRRRRNPRGQREKGLIRARRSSTEAVARHSTVSAPP